MVSAFGWLEMDKQSVVDIPLALRDRLLSFVVPVGSLCSSCKSLDYNSTFIQKILHTSIDDPRPAKSSFPSSSAQLSHEIYDTQQSSTNHEVAQDMIEHIDPLVDQTTSC